MGSRNRKLHTDLPRCVSFKLIIDINYTIYPFNTCPATRQLGPQKIRSGQTNICSPSGRHTDLKLENLSLFKSSFNKKRLPASSFPPGHKICQLSEAQQSK